MDNVHARTAVANQNAERLSSEGSLVIEERFAGGHQEPRARRHYVKPAFTCEMLTINIDGESETILRPPSRSLFSQLLERWTRSRRGGARAATKSAMPVDVAADDLLGQQLRLLDARVRGAGSSDSKQ